MSCSSCMRENPCGCKKKKSCDDCPVVDWVPNTACTIGVTMNGCTDTLELRPGIQNCETKTVFKQNPTTGCLEYQNELYVATDGAEGYVMSVCPVDIAKFINLEDLANVEDEQPENCSLLVYKAESDCGPGCTGVSDSWVHWYASEHLSNGLHWVAGFNENGCLEALDVPTDTSKYWWGMWRPSDTGNGTEFGYIQPTEVSKLPTNAAGDSMVISQDANGKPIYGPVSFADWWNKSVCTTWIPASGFEISYDQHGSGANSFCIFPHRGQATCGLDLFVSSAMNEQTFFDLHVATLADKNLWPPEGSGFWDFPINPVWANNTDGAIIPLMYRIDDNGRLLVSGHCAKREASGKSRFIVLGLDSTITYNARNVS